MQKTVSRESCSFELIGLPYYNNNNNNNSFFIYFVQLAFCVHVSHE